MPSTENFCTPAVVPEAVRTGLGGEMASESSVMPPSLEPPSGFVPPPSPASFPVPPPVPLSSVPGVGSTPPQVQPDSVAIAIRSPSNHVFFHMARSVAPFPDHRPRVGPGGAVFPGSHRFVLPPGEAFGTIFRTVVLPEERPCHARHQFQSWPPAAAPAPPPAGQGGA